MLYDNNVTYTILDVIQTKVYICYRYDSQSQLNFLFKYNSVIWIIIPCIVLYLIYLMFVIIYVIDRVKSQKKKIEI